MCEKYLERYHRDVILQILENLNENKHFSININFIELFENDPNLGSSVLKSPEKSLQEWNQALKTVQNNIILQSERSFIFKNHVQCRIYGLPICPELHRTIFPKNEDANKFLQICGTIVRMTNMKMLEYQRRYMCVKCKYVMHVMAEYDKYNIITAPKKCGNPDECKGSNIVSMGELDAEFCKDYQEIKMQETVNKLDVGSIPNSIWVTLEDDLVDSCKPGDNITVCGILKKRWKQFTTGKKLDIELVIKANHIQVNNNNASATSVTPELKDMFQGFWQTYADRPLAARDIILKSICPQIFGLHLVKLAMAVVLAGGTQVKDTSGTGVRVRAEPHLLLVGDPGTGKSQLLRFASKIIPRSILTTGVGSTAAGLTVTAIMENGEWQLEGGALVLSDGGICCIDEFNSMKEHDRTSIHEAMEQQTISVAKASIVCKLSTKCSVLAATNPKGNLDPSQPLTMNIALASPLLSRFDLILLLRDKVNTNWDSLVADYILNSQKESSKLTDNIHWNLEILQAYFAVIKKIHPTLTDDSNSILSSYYQAQRRKNCRNKSRTTVRLLDSLVRLSQGHARLMYRKQVEIVDAIQAVVLIETAMEAEYALFDLNFNVQKDFPDCPMRHYREIAEIVLKKLSLHDLLEKELAILDEKQETEKREMKNSSQIPQIESHFFNLKEQKEKLKPIPEDDKLTNIDNNKFGTDEEIIEKVTKKRSKGKNINQPMKKRKEEINDLEALDMLPTINDTFLFDINRFDDTSIQENLTINDNTVEKIKTEDDQSQRTKCRNFLNKFKYIPKENIEESNANIDQPILNKDISERKDCNKFKFKKKNDVKIILPKPGDTMFETHEDIENINLDI